ncbi:glycosyltransferase family 4 protein [Pseudohongiella sp.]|uniref:Glycosyl transferase family 1 domain-containing protein n=1 Tax=marine sediment metagenome TaxID=412755 RepID=A0A0F9W9T5_9ZZZZ|nr:glycosyltransferase family 4 protein [Pseudohongiella sp.]HDZ07933.1 glycosyltransferase [Pseudohongiella sp.]HEA64460.1 glycosyltransferase [Pseudohongiella sp.]
MTLAFLIYQYFPYGGQQRDFRRIAERCVAAGYQIRVYCLKWQGDIPDGLTVVKVPVSAVSRHVMYQRFSEWVSAALKQKPVAAVVGFSKMPGLDVYFAADPCFAERMRREGRLITRLLPRYRHFMRHEEAVFGPDSSTTVMLLSPRQQQDFVYHYRDCGRRLHRLPPGLDRDRVPGADAPALRQRFRKQFGVQDDEHAVLQIGSGFRVKGLDRSLRALAALPEPVRNKTRFFIVGQDKPAKYQRLARRLGIRQQCQFLGGRDDVPMFLQGCDLLLHPALSESAGYTLLEAVINGLPVLTTDTCGYAFHVSDAGAGQVCPSPFVQKDLNARLHEMLISSDRSRWQNNGLAYAKKVNLFGLADAALAIIEQVLREKSTSENGDDNDIASAC